MGLWQASPREDCPSFVILFLFWCNLSGFGKDGSEQESFSVWHHILCCKFVSGISEESAYFQPFSSNSPKVFPSLTVSKIYIFFLPGRDHWVFFFLFTYFNLHLFAQPYPETNSHLHLYRKMHCMERIFYFLQIFSNIILVGPPKTGLIIHYSDCCFVFLFVIGMGRDSGWRMWEAQLGGTDTIIYS